MCPNVMIVEDDQSHLKFLSIALEHADFGVTCAETAEEGLVLMASRLPDVLLVDWMLPLMKGTALVQKLRRSVDTRDLAVMMLSARCEENDKVAALECGADDYLTKPLNVRELVARIHALLRRRQPADDRTLRVQELSLDPVTQRAVGPHG